MDNKKSVNIFLTIVAQQQFIYSLNTEEKKTIHCLTSCKLDLLLSFDCVLLTKLFFIYLHAACAHVYMRVCARLARAVMMRLFLNVKLAFVVYGDGCDETAARRTVPSAAPPLVCETFYTHERWLACVCLL